MDKPDLNPNATIQLDRPSLLDTVVLDDDDADAALVRDDSVRPPPLPPSLAPVMPLTAVTSVAPPAPKGKPAWLIPVLLVVGLAVAVGAGIKVGGALHSARATNAPEPASMAVGAGAAQPTVATPSAGPTPSAPVITVPIVEMNDPH